METGVKKWHAITHAGKAIRENRMKRKPMLLSRSHLNKHFLFSTLKNIDTIILFVKSNRHWKENTSFCLERSLGLSLCQHVLRL